jgi:hypothetical protein
LRVMYRLTGETAFVQMADHWERCARNPLHRARAFCYKAAFKLCYY